MINSFCQNPLNIHCQTPRWLTLAWQARMGQQLTAGNCQSSGLHLRSNINAGFWKGIKWWCYRLWGIPISPTNQTCGVLGCSSGRFTPLVECPTPEFPWGMLWSMWRKAIRWISLTFIWLNRLIYWRKLLDGSPWGMSSPGLHHHERCKFCSHFLTLFQDLSKSETDKCDITLNVAQAWELEPEKRPTFAASRDSLDLFRTQNPQWRRRRTFPRTSKKTWKWMPVSSWSDSQTVIKKLPVMRKGKPPLTQ